MPPWVPWAAAAIVAVAILSVGAAVLYSRLTLVPVPSVEGLTVTEATRRLDAVGMRLEVGDRRFSAKVGRDLIVGQTPDAGSRGHRGDVIVVAVSAGSESFRMPDVIGWRFARAKSTLEGRGLEVVVDYAPSDLTSGTVLASFPSGGVTLSTGDTVRITVATADTSGGLLLPIDLRGRSFVLDPAPMPVAGMPDAPMDVARRLRALLEASGATVTVTRDVTDVPAISLDERARRAHEGTSTALVGFAVTQTGAQGIVVLTVPAEPSTSPFFIGSASLGTAVQGSLRSGFADLRTTPGTGDALLTSAGVPAARVVLGSAAAPADVRSFSDPSWADTVAQAVYRALGSLYGSK